MSDVHSTPGRGARIATAIGRILFGLLFLVAGGFGAAMASGAMPQHIPEDMQPRALAFITALGDTGYMNGLIAITQLIVAVLMLSNRCVPLALALVAPFLVHAVCFHLFLERGGLVPSLVITALMLALAWAYRGSFAPMLAPRARTGDRWTRVI